MATGNAPEGYRIEGNITEINYRAQHPADVYSFTFVPEQNYTVTVDDKTRAVFVDVDTQHARHLVYDKKLTIEFKDDSKLDWALGKSTLIFAEKDCDEFDVTVKSDSDATKILELRIVTYGVRL